MKFKKIEQILKQRNIIYVIKEKDRQWIGNGEAFYQVNGLPDLTMQTVMTIMDVPENSRGSWIYEEVEKTDSYSLQDVVNNESLVDRYQIGVVHHREYVALRTSIGLQYIANQYLAPLQDEKNGNELYERVGHNGNMYIAVKSGLLLRAIIMPNNKILENTIELLQNMAEQADIAMDHIVKLPEEGKYHE